MKERQTKTEKVAESILGLIWLWALVEFMARGGISFFPLGVSSHADFTPALLAAGWSVVVFLVVAFILRHQSAAGKSLGELQSQSPDVFEDWVAARFRGLGYSVRVAGLQGDHGVDLVVEKAGERAVVQCKNYKKWSVGEPVLRDLYGAMHDFDASRAYLVTTGRSTRAAVGWVGDKPIEIWDGQHLDRLSKEMAKAARRAPVPLPIAATAPTVEVTQAIDSAVKAPPLQTNAVTCPKCGSTLVQRRNRTTGEPFLACPGYPACRYTKPMPSKK